MFSWLKRLQVHLSRSIRDVEERNSPRICSASESTFRQEQGTSQIRGIHARVGRAVAFCAVLGLAGTAVAGYLEASDAEIRLSGGVNSPQPPTSGAEQKGLIVQPHPCDCPPDHECIPIARMLFSTPVESHAFPLGEEIAVEAHVCNGINYHPTITVQCPGLTFTTHSLSFLMTPPSTGECEVMGQASPGGPPVRASGKETHSLPPGTVTARVAFNVVGPPTVELTSPLDSAVYLAGDTVNLSANASDVDGQIDRVEFEVRFRREGGLVFSHVDSTAPYGVNMPNVATGGYTVTARAFDDDGNESTDTRNFSVIPVNLPPTISITAPAASSFIAPATINFEAAASDPDGSVSRVEFELRNTVTNAVVLSGADSDSLQPYTITASALPAGNYVMHARAIDNDGASADASKSFSVAMNNHPVANILAPTNNQILALPGSIELRATATDSDGTIHSVEFRHGAGGATLIGQGVLVGGSTYSLNWNGMAIGDYQIIARARDNNGAIVDSPVRILRVRANTAPRDAVLVRPAPNPQRVSVDGFYNVLRYSDNIFPSNQLMSLQARFQDTEGNFDRVEFYRNARTPENLLATVRPATPGLTSFTAIAEIQLGSSLQSELMQYVFAVAYDSSGGEVTTVKAPVAIHAPYDWEQIASCSPGTPYCWPPGNGHAIPGLIQAERYDFGGAGVSYFDTDAYRPPADSGLQGNPRNDDVDIYNCGWNSTYLSDSCLISGRRPAEWQTWKVRFNQGGVYGIYMCFKDERSSVVSERPLSEIPVEAPFNNTVVVRFDSASGQSFDVPLQLAPAPDEGSLSGSGPEGSGGVTLPPCDGEGQYLDYALLPYDFASNYVGRMTVFAAEDEYNASSYSFDWVALLPESGIGSALGVAISQPLEGAAFSYPLTQPITIRTDVMTVGTGTFVRFFYSSAVNGGFETLIGGDDTAPYELAWTPPAVGEYRLVAKVYSYINGVLRQVDSSPVNIRVTTAPLNQPPLATLLQPTGGMFASGTAVPLRASAVDVDGTVSRVEFVISRNGTVLGAPILGVNVPGAPGEWSATWTAPVTAGTYQLRARAFDAATPQAMGESSIVNVSVQSLPGLAQELPADVPASVPAASDGVGATAGAFRVDETGAATYAIPLAVVPGRAGVAPEMALSYSSQGGMGVMGRGWSIAGASAITRCRQTAEAGDADAMESGSPPLSFDGDDRYCLDGQRLMLIAGSYDPTAATMEFRTEIDGFARIRAFNTNGQNGPNYFVVQAKDGTTSWYGDSINGQGLPFMPANFAPVARTDAALRRNDGSGQTVPENAPVLAFALARRMDSFGNYVDYQYETHQEQGEQLLARVDFTGKTVLASQSGSASAPFASIRLAYSNLPASAVREAWQSGMRVRASKRLDRVRSYQDESVIREYRLDYSTYLSRSAEFLLGSVTECASSDAAAVCYPPTRFDWTLAGNSASGPLPQRVVNSRHGVPRYNKEDAKAWQLGDVDGDGRLDVVHFQNQSSGTQRIETLFREVGVSEGGWFPFRPLGQFVYSLRAQDDLADAWFLHDFNSDGRDDLMLAEAHSDAYTNPGDPPGTQWLRSWRIYPSNGRVNDGSAVFNESSTWLQPCPAGDPDAPNCIPVNSGDVAQAQLVDFNGDGLSDVIYPSPVAGEHSLKIKLGTRSSTGQPGFSRAYDAVLERFSDCSAVGQNVTCTYAFSSVQSRNGRSPYVFDLNADGRGDLWLLANKMTQESCPNGICPDPQDQPEYPMFFSAGSAKDLDEQLDVRSSMLAGRAAGTSSTVSEWSFSAQVVDTIDHTTRRIVFKQYARRDLGVTLPSQNQIFPVDMNLDGVSDVLIATKVGGNYHVHLLKNTGASFLSPQSPLAGGGSVVLPEAQFNHMQLVDLNNDGYVDLMYPNGAGSNSQWRVHAGGPAGFGAEESAGIVGDVLPSHHKHFFADFDGNGDVEYVRFRHRLGNDSNGWDDVSHSRLASDLNPSVGAGKPAAHIHRISNGYGADTSIVYQPLTNSAVYLREPRWFGANPGEGSPVIDLFGAMYVVASVSSDAPGLSATSRRSTLYYQYAGAKLQAGGRGLMGFRQVRTLDPNFDGSAATHIVSITDYGLKGCPITVLSECDDEVAANQSVLRHGFPYVGMPRESRQYQVASAVSSSLITCLATGGNANDASCYSNFGAAGTANPYFEEPTGTLLSYARNRLSHAVTATGPFGERSVFPYIEASFEAKGNPEHLATGRQSISTLSETVSRFEYNTAWGDLLRSAIGTASGSGYANLSSLRIDALARLANASVGSHCAGHGDCVSSVQTVNTWLSSSQPQQTAANDRDYWRLGRLDKSTVTHWRQGAHGESTSSLTRESRFEYDVTGAARTGALTVERVAGLSTPGSAKAANESPSELRTVRKRDAYGNVTDTFVCSGDVPDLVCEDANQLLQRPAGSNGLPLTRVHRHTRTAYDSHGRYPVSALAPYFDGTPDGALHALETVELRDVLGNVLQTSRLNGGIASATYGPLGRQQTSTDSTGSESVSEFHWCAGGGATGQVAACPSDIGAVFRQTAYTYGGTRSVTYFDRLGREVFVLSESFNRYDSNAGNDWVGVCKTYDGRGRTVAVSEPFFVTNVATSGLRPELSTAASCASKPSTRTTYDVLDRALTIRLPEHVGTTTAMSEMVYSGLQTTTYTRLSRATSPFQTPVVVTLSEVRQHDASGQVLTVTDAEGLVAKYAHDAAGNLIALKREAGRDEIVSRISYDALGRKTGQLDPDAGAASYAYNAASELICSQDARGYATITDFDALGRGWRSRTLKTSCASTTTIAMTLSNADASILPTAMTDDHSSVDLTVYDLAGNGVGQIDSILRKHRVGSSYAGYRGIADDQGEFEQTSSYDGFGRPSQVNTRFYEPNLDGSGLSERKFTQRTTYDTLGRVATTQDATGGVVENMYSAHGFLRRVRDAGQPSLVFWELLETDARGQTTLDRRHGKVELTQQRQYNEVTGRLARIITGTQGSNGQIHSAVQNLSYVFDAQGNLLSRKDERANGREEVFVYDRLNRLIEARLDGISPTPGANTPTLTLSYDKLGNICSKNGMGYSYAGRSGCGLNGLGGSGGPGSASPHAVTARGPVGNQLQYQYDAAGNMTTTAGGPNGTRTVRFDGAGNADRLSISTQSTSFWYAGGGRYLRLDESSDTPAKLTRYLGGVEWIVRSGGGAEERKRSIGGFLLLTETGSTQAPTRKYRYLLADHLGSTDTLVDENGVVHERMSFDAHGSRRAADSGSGMWASLLAAVAHTDINPQVNAETTRGFTGHEHVDRMGLIHMNGRLYDPLLGRMLSPDPIVQEPYNAQNLNRYSYVLNNPLSYTDPSGLSFVKKYWRQVVAIAISVFVPVLAPALAASFWGAVAIGFTSGVVATGSLEGGLWGAFGAGVFHGIGVGFQNIGAENGANFSGAFGTNLTGPQFAGQVLSHATAGGVISVMQGGKFGHGFGSAGISKAAGPATANAPNDFVRAGVHALIGGTASVASGGKFANGAITSAMAFAFNQAASSYRSRVRAHNPFWRLGNGFEATVDLFEFEGELRHEFHVFDKKQNEVGMFKDGAFFNKHGHLAEAPRGFTRRNLSRLIGLDNHMLVTTGRIQVSDVRRAGLDHHQRGARVFRALGWAGAAVTAGGLLTGETTFAEAFGEFTGSTPVGCSSVTPCGSYIPDLPSDG